MAFLVSKTQPTDISLGDEWFNPTTNELKKLVAFDGTTVGYKTIYQAGTVSTISASSNTSASANVVVVPDFSVIGTSTYDATRLGTYVHIDNLTTTLTSSGYFSTMASSGFLKYRIKTGTSSYSDITVSYAKSGANVSQSAFSLLGQTLAYTAATSTIYNYSNDDHDSLVMDADGCGVLSRTNTNSVNNNWDKFKGSAEVVTNVVLDTAFNFSPSAFLASATNATIVSFPKTSSAVWLNISAGTYKTNNYTPQSSAGALATATAPSTTAPQSSLYTISDGVNSFIVGRYGQLTAAYCIVDLSTGIITARQMTVVNQSASVNSTEEDAFGDQLFTVDGKTGFFQSGNFYYGGTRDWKDSLVTTAWSTTTGLTAFAAGVSTQNGADIYGSVDSDGFLWFADWGHDNGGLFNVGSDSTLGTRPTNIKMVDNNYTN